MQIFNRHITHHVTPVVIFVRPAALINENAHRSPLHHSATPQ